MKNITAESIIGELVAENYQLASIFKKHNIDFCCNGNRTILEVCSTINVESEHLINELMQIKERGHGNIDYSSWPLDLLVSYIVKKHHRYVEEKITEIKPYLAKIVQVHAEQHPELIEVQELFLDSADELTQHMKREELILFPYIERMVQSQLTGKALAQPQFQTVENPISMMKEEHDNEGERFRKITELTNNYTPPADGCNTYKVTFIMLKEFEDDLHEHIHLENNILFPKTEQLEQQLTKST